MHRDAGRKPAARAEARPHKAAEPQPNAPLLPHVVCHRAGVEKSLDAARRNARQVRRKIVTGREDFRAYPKKSGLMCRSKMFSVTLREMDSSLCLSMPR